MGAAGETGIKLYLCQGCGCVVHPEYFWTHAARDERLGVSATFTRLEGVKQKSGEDAGEDHREVSSTV